MQFGFDGYKGQGARQGLVAVDSSAREGLPLSALIAEASEAGVAGALPQGRGHAQALLAHAELLREIARRGGQVEMLARAAAAANRARREAGGDPALEAAAALSQAETQRLGFQLFADDAARDEAAAQAKALLEDAPAPLIAIRARALLAQLNGGLALAAGDRAVALEALQALELAAKAASALRETETVLAVQLDRAELMIGLGLAGHDRTLLAAAATALGTIAAGAPAERRPLSWMRAETLRGQALAALGEVAGDAAAIAEAVAALKAAAAAATALHAPLDSARAQHALGLALQALGEACDEDVLFDRAIQAFSPALQTLDRVAALPYRAVVAHDGALCLARRAERRCDLKALEQAEAVFRDALKSRGGVADPVAWAVTQVALARIYEAQATLRPDTGERADATFALASALDVFAERGLRSLSATALAALDRLKTAA